MALSSKYGDVQVNLEPGNPLNDTDEPVFILRARDRTSVLALTMYLQGALGNGAGHQVAVGMQEEIRRFRTWQAENPELVKIPD